MIYIKKQGAKSWKIKVKILLQKLLNLYQNKNRKKDEKKRFLKLILSYFGEKNAKNCGKCSACEKQKSNVFGRNIAVEIVQILQEKPSNVEEIAIKLNYFEKETILENLIFLLDSGKVKMLNFRTYSLNYVQ